MNDSTRDPSPELTTLAPSPAAVPPESAVDCDTLRTQLATLAGEGILIGTSSWKYPGWVGSLYTRDRYMYRGKFAESRFERDCLAEYASVFHTVCVDAAYYTFPSEKYLAGLAAQVPDTFQFTFKVTDEITIRHFPRLPRFGPRAGTDNECFLNAPMFIDRFLGPMETIRSKVGVFLFEFSRFYPSDFARGRDFIAALDEFLGELPTTWRYGVEIRNKTFLQPEYFACLARHGVAHVFNSWEAMPSIADQLQLPDNMPASFIAARLLLRPGRDYKDAVKAFSPYDRIRDSYPEGRAAAVQLMREALKRGRKPALVYVNNRFEGYALATISRLVEELERSKGKP